MKFSGVKSYKMATPHRDYDESRWPFEVPEGGEAEGACTARNHRRIIVITFSRVQWSAARTTIVSTGILVNTP